MRAPGLRPWHAASSLGRSRAWPVACLVAPPSLLVVVFQGRERLVEVVEGVLRRAPHLVRVRVRVRVKVRVRVRVRVRGRVRVRVEVVEGVLRRGAHLLADHARAERVLQHLVRVRVGVGVGVRVRVRVSYRLP